MVPKHLVVCIDYFSKWSEAKPIKDKSASTVAQFLYEVICPHGCMKIQINDQGREFVNDVSKVLHNMIGSTYHPQSNGVCEQQNRTIKDSLVKVLDGISIIGPIYSKVFYFCIGLANIFQQNFLHSSLCITGRLLYQSMSSII